MREIKFRGIFGKYWEKGKKTTWKYGYYVEELGVSFLHDGEKMWGVNPETVGQNTHLKDKNGKDIYEGDIVEYGYDFSRKKGKVIWIGSNFALSPYCEPLDMWNRDMEVIGNIYENPELLKSE